MPQFPKPEDLPDDQRIVITGLGLTPPNGSSLAEFRDSLLNGRSGIQDYEIRYFGKTVAGICDFDVKRHQSRRDARRGTRAGSVGIYCAREAIASSGLDWDNVCLLYTSPSPRDKRQSRMPSSA